MANAKMTNRERAEAYFLRLEGVPVNEIANRYGVSASRIYQILPIVYDRAGDYARKCVYPNIAAWLVRNRVSYSAFSKMIGFCYASAQGWLTGKRIPDKKAIDAVLKVTGLTYEEAFKEGDACQEC